MEGKACVSWHRTLPKSDPARDHISHNTTTPHHTTTPPYIVGRRYSCTPKDLVLHTEAVHH
jgi:hypothetical protein